MVVNNHHTGQQYLESRPANKPQGHSCKSSHKVLKQIVLIGNKLKLSRELLLLKCNKYSLEAKGSNKKLADCLDNHFKAIHNECKSEQLERHNSTTNAQATSQGNADQLAMQDP